MFKWDLINSVIKTNEFQCHSNVLIKHIIISFIFRHYVHCDAHSTIVPALVHRQVSVYDQTTEQSRCIRVGRPDLELLAGGDHSTVVRLGRLR